MPEDGYVSLLAMKGLYADFLLDLVPVERIDAVKALFERHIGLVLKPITGEEHCLPPTRWHLVSYLEQARYHARQKIDKWERELRTLKHGVAHELLLKLLAKEQSRLSAFDQMLANIERGNGGEKDGQKTVSI